MQAAPPTTGQSADVVHGIWAFVPALQASVDEGFGQSRDSPWEFVLVHAAPWFGLPSQTPTHGEPGVPAHGAPAIVPTRQSGQGWVTLPVTIVREVSETFIELTPVEVSSVPLAGAANVFATQVERPGLSTFGIGSGVPKEQPVFVQSMAPTGASVGPMVHDEPAQVVVKRFVEPSGVGPSATVDSPPPMLSPPQVRFFNTAPVPSVVR